MSVIWDTFINYGKTHHGLGKVMNTENGNAELISIAFLQLLICLPITHGGGGGDVVPEFGAFLS